jgi:hypothetical protein
MVASITIKTRITNCAGGLWFVVANDNEMASFDHDDDDWPSGLLTLY